MKRTFRIGPFLPAAAAAAVLCICLILASLPATAVTTPETRSTPQPAVRSAFEPAASAPAVRQLNVSYAAPPAAEPAQETTDNASAQPPQTYDDPQTDSTSAAGDPAPEQGSTVGTPAQEPAGEDVPEELVLLDTFIATAYCVTGTTSTGTYTTAGRTLAVNPDIIPYGTHVWLYLDDGTLVGDYYAEDTGSNMMAHPYVIDIYMGEGSYNDCILWGAQHVSVYVEADAS